MGFEFNLGYKERTHCWASNLKADCHKNRTIYCVCVTVMVEEQYLLYLLIGCVYVVV